ncbi:transcription factor PAR1 [Pyrus x bretschneideri]|uniref:transcription factor PAR1 n=1 Tax=Pyrus x bretschneideri TaxID=225117 RepID=UPI00202DCDAD|nr:transcription factor PAR1 [Pyrus x bretschneideri]
MEEAQTQTLTQTQLPKSTFKRKHRKNQLKPRMGNGVQESLSSKNFLQRAAESTHGRSRKQNMKSDMVNDVKTASREEEDGEKEEVERKIEALQRIVPGGESRGVDELFEETAGYIMALQGQLKAMKELASFVEGLEKEKRKFGG